ncbi:putative bifunctional diguanylate cyclase/phosphodiesterase [Sphingomonas jaspsi]|uniref:putative bifunctional diguanylate cyclase/phosphodiesterase n=1 Tax=Sphingomonas jaspsi TaxID=392409 RepID=UPI0004B1682A|nr:EAL domain-containing protein [Sphingomonas jaspsi]
MPRAARTDWFVLAILVAAVAMLIWNGSDFFIRITSAGGRLGAEAKIAATALTLNVALILFGWRRYGDLLHEASMRRDSEARAALIASTDALTGLLNRKGFADEGEAMRAGARSDGRHLAVMSIQLNRFKAVNDRHGYDVGDKVIRAMAETLVEGAGPEAIVARLSGDEFAIAMPCDGDQDASVVSSAERILRSLTRPILVDDKMIQVGAFIGITWSDPDLGQVRDHLRRADIALDHARSTCSVRPIWFDDSMERAMIAHSELEQGIRHGLEHGQFVPHFEPQVDLLTGGIVGFEVLARWQHPLGGQIGPDVFIPIAEEYGLIGRLSEQVMLAAMRQAASWDPAIQLSVNISPRQLGDGWLAQRIVRLLTEAGFPADRLVVEITESSLFSDLELARSIVTSLKNQGVRLALDDFGTGFSSLSHLRALPFDYIKIDRCFVSTLDEQPESAAIVRAVSTLAEALKVPVIVEGIADARTHAALAGYGCAIGQGWYFGKPMTAEQATELLRTRAERPAETPQPQRVRRR